MSWLRQKKKWENWIILCNHVNNGGCIVEPRKNEKNNKFCVETVSIHWKLCVQNNDKFCVEKVSINWKLCGQENLSTLCFESLQNEIDIDVPKSLDINQKMEECCMKSK